MVRFVARFSMKTGPKDTVWKNRFCWFGLFSKPNQPELNRKPIHLTAVRNFENASRTEYL